MYLLNKFETKVELDNCLATKVATLLQAAVTKNGKASFAVSGGSTPKGFFNQLSQQSIDWDKVTISLVDERWLDESHQDSNTRLVKEQLLINDASKAAFFSLKQEQDLTSSFTDELGQKAITALLPFDVAILGMGTDGHTASLFPCSEQISCGLSENNESPILAVSPQTAPYQRITFSFNALKNTNNLFLHITGENKLDVMEQAIAAQPIEMPIGAFLNHVGIELQVYWTK